MEILELKLLHNKEKILSSIDAIQKDLGYLKDPARSLDLAESLNEMALVLMGEDKVQEALEFLRRAESLSIASAKHKAQSFNSIASFYRKQGKIVTALKYIERSIGVHPSGSAYLNLCAVLSVQGKFDKALEIAMHTIIFIQDEVIEERGEHKEISSENAEMLSVAYYNLAVQLEYLKRADEAGSYYRKAVEFSGKYLQEDNCVREVLKQIFDKIVAGTGKPLEIKVKSEVVKPQIKRRVIIKGGVRSPASKSPMAKEEKKLVRNAVSHRKFVKVGITKAKFLENYANAVGKGDESGEDRSKSASRLGKSEISFKSKVEKGEVDDKKKGKKGKKGEKNEDGKEIAEQKHKEIVVQLPDKKIEEVDSDKKITDPEHPLKHSQKSAASSLKSPKNSDLLINSFENAPETEDFLKNPPNLSPVSKNISGDLEKFGLGTDENFADFIENDETKKNFKIEENEAKEKSENFEEDEKKQEKWDEGFKENQEYWKRESREIDEMVMQVVNESDAEDDISKDIKIQASAEHSLKFPMKLSKTNRDSLFDSFQLPRRSNNSQSFLTKYL